MEYNLIVNPDYTYVCNSGITLTHLANVGGAAEVYKEIVAETATFRTLSGDSTINITQSANTINFSVNDDAWVSTDEFTGYTATTNNTLTGLTAQVDVNTAQVIINTEAIETITGGTTGFVLNTTFTGYTATTQTDIDLKAYRTDFVGAGGTNVYLSGDTLTIFSAPPTGATVSWGNIFGTLSNQVDLQTELDNLATGITANAVEVALKVDESLYNSDMLVITTQIDDNEANISGNTAQISTNTGDISTLQSSKLDTSIFNAYSATTTPALAGKVDDSVYQADLIVLTDAIDANATGNTSNYALITGNTSLINSNSADILTVSGLTVTNAQAITGKTSPTDFVGSGATEITVSGSSVIVYVDPNIVTGTTWGAISGTLTNQTDLNAVLTGKTEATNFIASGATVITTDGNDVYIYTTPTTGATVSWGSIGGTLSSQTDLVNALALKLDITDFGTYTGDTSTLIGTKLDASVFNSYTGTTATELSNLNDAITGNTESIGLKLNTTDYEAYTGATETRLQGIEGDVINNYNAITGITADISTIQGDIITVSGLTVTNAGNISTNAGDIVTISGLTVSNAGDIVTVSGLTVNNAGDIITVSGLTVTNAGNISNNTTGITANYNSITANTESISTLETQVLGITGDTAQITQDLNTHTGDTGIHFTQAQITGYTKTVDFQGAGGTQVDLSGSTLIISSAVPTGATVSWGGINGTLADQTDLQNALNAKLAITDYNTYTGNTATELSNLNTGITANTAAIETKAEILANIVEGTGTTYTVSSSDSGKIIEMTNVAATTVYLPTGCTANMQVTVVNIGGSNMVFQAGASAAIYSSLNYDTNEQQYGAVTCYQRSNTGGWVIFGSLQS